MQRHRKGTDIIMPMMSDFKVLLLNRYVSLVPLRPETTGLSPWQSCIFDVAVVINV